MLDNLKAEVRDLGKESWRLMLAYAAELHARSVLDARPPFSRPWEEIGPGYINSPTFGHWDIVHAALDSIPAEPEHAAAQLLNNLENQQEDGLVPGIISVWGAHVRWNAEIGHPPVWPFAVHDLVACHGDDALITACFKPLARQLGWFETGRASQDGGFYYADIVNRQWESGVDEGVRFDDAPTSPLACVDATSHVSALYEFAAQWAPVAGEDGAAYSAKAQQLREFIQTRLFDEETGFFHDVWAVGDPARRTLAFEGIWPLVVGAASPEQAARVINENLLCPERFFTEHPIATVAACDPRFELRMWRGPAWNSMTYWAARGCLRYGRSDAAARLVERALDASALQFERTGTIWEFYHPHAGNQMDVARKPHTTYNVPCRNYLGHNPLVAMARMWQSIQTGEQI